MDIFSNIFKDNNLRFNIRNLKYLPRWFIVCLDIGILIVSFVMTFVFFFRMGLEYVKHDCLTYFITGLLVTNVFFFWLFRTYSGIIRHSSYIDAVKLLFSQLSVFIFFIFINYCFVVFTGEKLYLNTALFINLVFSFCGLFLYRVVVKQTFDIYFAESVPANNLMNTIIYGTDANAISVANAVKFETPTRFKIVGFVDKNGQNTSKRMLNVPILTQRRMLPTLMRSIGAKAVIIADKSLSKEEQNILVDQCLEYGYKVFNIPVISDWKNKNEISQKIQKLKIEDLLDRNPIVLDNGGISKQLKDKVVMITGAAGSIGSEIVRQVINFEPKLIVIIDQAETPLHHLNLNLEAKNHGVKIQTVITDIRNKNSMETVFSQYKPDVVFHAAAYKHVPLMELNPSQAILTNVEGSKNLADLSCKYNVGKFVMISTDKAVNPSNVMGASKRIAEKYVQSLHLKNSKIEGYKGTKFITTRFGNVLGSNGSVVPLFTKQITDGGPVTITHKDIIRYFMTIPEACQLVLEAGAMGNGGEIYIFDMGKPVKILDLAKKMIKLAGYTPGKEIQIKEIGLRPGEKLYEELLNDNSKTLPTYHEKIMISQEIQEEYEILHVEVAELIEIARNTENNNIVAKMKKIVPEFKSMNSDYEFLDKVTG